MSVNLPVEKYTSRDYETIRQELIDFLSLNVPDINDFLESNNAVVLLEAMAYILGSFHYYLDSRARQVFLDSVSEKSCAQMIAHLLGYSPSPAISSEVFLKIGTAAGITGSVVIPAGEQAYCTIDNKRIVFETAEETVLTSGEREKVVLARQRETQMESFISSGLARQRFKLAYTPFCLIKSVKVNGFAWGQISGFWNAYSSSLCYRVDHVYESAAIVFGNGTQGSIPPKGSAIEVIYYTSSGSSGNVTAGAIKNMVNPIFTDTNGIRAAIYVNNDSPSASGSDSETVDAIKRNAPRYARMYGRAVCAEDYIYAIESSFASVLRAGVATSETFGEVEENTVMVIVCLADGVILSQSLRDEINRVFRETYPKPLTTALLVSEAQRRAADFLIEWEEEEGFSREKIEGLMLEALGNYFDPANRNFDFGQPVHLSRVVHLLQSINGVKYLNLKAPLLDIQMESPRQLPALGGGVFSEPV